MFKVFPNRLTVFPFCIVLLFSLPFFLFAQDIKEVSVKVKPNQSIREISQEYLGDPDLWEDILKTNNLKSAADVKPGMVLTIPIAAISMANRELSKSSTLIEKATKLSAKIFTPDMIAEAISFRNQALDQKKQGDWKSAASLAISSWKIAQNAIDVCLSKKDVPAEAVVRHTAGKVQQRKHGKSIWINSKIKNLLGEGDRIRTLSDSYTEVAFMDDSRLRLNSNAQAMIQKMRSNLLDNENETSVSLIEGDVLAMLSGNKKKSNFNFAVKGIETKINSNKFWVEKTKADAKFANFEGEIEIASAGSKVLIKKNQGSIVKNNEKPSKPHYLLPMIELIEPLNGIDLFESKIKFTWKPRADAHKYRIEISRDGQFAKIAASLESSQTSITLPDKLESGVFHWRVCGISKEGLPGQQGLSRSFHLIDDNTPPFIIVTKPGNDLIVTENSVQVTGSTENNASVVVQNNPVKVAIDGSFTHIAKLEAGENKLIITAEDLAGNQTTIELNVLYSTGKSVLLTFNPALACPKDKHFLSQSSGFSLSGTTNPLSRISIKAVPDGFKAETQTDRDGNFSFNLNLLQNVNQFSMEIITIGNLKRTENIIVEIDDVSPQISLESDIETVTSEQSIELAGSVEGCSKLEINNIAVGISENLFNHEIPLKTGKNKIKIIASDLAGNHTYIEKEIYLDSEPPVFLNTKLSLIQAKGGETVQIKVTAKDASKLSRASSFSVEIGDFNYSGHLILTPGKEEYTGSVRIPPDVKGKVIVTKVILSDYLGNRKEYSFK